MRPSVPAAAVAVVLTIVVAACSAPGGRSSPVDGVWRTDGYGWVISVRNGQAETYDMTSLSCLPNRTLTQLDEPGPDGSVQFGNEHGAVETLRLTPDGKGALRLLGTAADIDLIPMPELPEMCSRPVPADPISTFDVFWATFAENYNSTARKNIDWNAVRDRYRPMVNADTTPEELYRVLVDMIDPLGDAHAALDANGESFAGKREGTRDEDDMSRQDATNAVDEHLRQDLGVSDIQTFANNRIAYADLPGGIGYLRLTSFDKFDPDDNRFPANSAVLAQTLDSIFTQERIDAWRGLIIDVRFNTGGDDELGLQLASRLTGRPYTAYTKQARNDPNDPRSYGRLRTATVTPSTGPRYTGPVRLLTSDLTVSAGETFTEAMLGRTPTPSRVGTSTQGVFSDDMERKLPNGWSFTLGNEEYYAPDGTDYEDAGVPPTIETPVFTSEERAQHRDSALDAPWPELDATN